MNGELFPRNSELLRIFFIIYRAESTHIPHTLATVEVAQFFSNYFVNEARKSEHKFSNKNELLGLTIENFSPVFTAKDGSNYFQTYLFKKM